MRREAPTIEVLYCSVELIMGVYLPQTDIKISPHGDRFAIGVPAPHEPGAGEGSNEKGRCNGFVAIRNKEGAEDRLPFPLLTG